jgi:hypothetical protein
MQRIEILMWENGVPAFALRDILKLLDRNAVQVEKTCSFHSQI